MSDEQQQESKKTKSGFFNHLFKLLTLGGLLAIFFRWLSQQNKKK